MYVPSRPYLLGIAYPYGYRYTDTETRFANRPSLYVVTFEPIITPSDWMPTVFDPRATTPQRPLAPLPPILPFPACGVVWLRSPIASPYRPLEGNRGRNGGFVAAARPLYSRDPREPMDAMLGLPYIRRSAGDTLLR